MTLSRVTTYARQSGKWRDRRKRNPKRTKRSPGGVGVKKPDLVEIISIQENDIKLAKNTLVTHWRGLWCWPPVALPPRSVTVVVLTKEEQDSLQVQHSNTGIGAE